MSDIFINDRGESVILFENADGTATGILEGEAERIFKSYKIAMNMLKKAGFKED